MIKRLLPILFCFFTFVASAQMSDGDWQLNPVFTGTKVQNIIDTGNKVFYLSDGCLFSYDKLASKHITYDKRNNISDRNILNIFYNYDKKYLFVAYESSNIDLIFDNGKVVNVPDIKNTVVTGSKKINWADFADNNEVYLATDFGYMIFDDEKYVIKKTYFYNKQLYSIVATDKYIYACWDNTVWASDKNANHYSPASFKKTNLANVKLQKLNNNYVCEQGGSARYRVYEQATGGDPLVLTMKQEIAAKVLNVSKSADGYTACFANYYYNLDENGFFDASKKVTFKADSFTNQVFSSLETDGSMWCFDKSGLKHFTVNSDGTITYLMDNHRPNASSVSYPFYLKYKNDRLYAMSSGKNNFNYDQYIPFELSYKKNGQWKDLAPATLPRFVNSQSNKKLNSPYGLEPDPEDPEKVWFGSVWEGAMCVKDNEVIQKFDSINSPMIVKYLCQIPDLKFDSHNNLWMIYDNEADKTNTVLYMLPAEKRFTEITKDDWITFNIDNTQIVSQARLFITSDDKIVVFNNLYFYNNLFVLDYNGTPEDKSDDRQVQISSFVDQDNKGYKIEYIYNFKEDSEGKIWCATNIGVCYINSSDDFFSDNFHFNKVKIPRNDGTGMTDVLLDATAIADIAIDEEGRKWVATTAAGLYVVSADNKTVLKTFNKENSYLPSDVVYSVAIDNAAKTVYLGTENGMVEYNCDAVPSEQSFDKVYAYPNPVRPDFTGDIIINGLIKNSSVKIKIGSGEVIYQAVTDGGILYWNGCNSNGKPVLTGKYNVYASVDGADEVLVTTIFVIR